jgi:hypothetical protein
MKLLFTWITAFLLAVELNNQLLLDEGVDNRASWVSVNQNAHL